VPEVPPNDHLPDLVRPMLATPGKLPPNDDGWGYEFKWDGVRAIGYVQSGQLRLFSRNDREVTLGYPELTGLPAMLGGVPAILDGELVAYHDGVPNFNTIQERMHVRNPSAALVARVPVTYYLFDVLELGGHSTLSLPYTQRRDLLAELALEGDSVRTPPYFPGNGADILQASKDQRLEGVLAKRLDSGYLPGRRSPAWLKVKNTDHQEVVVGGWRAGQGRRAGMVGSLLLGVPEGPGLRYIGHVGTGFTEAMLRDLTERVGRLGRRTSPFSTPIPAEHARGAYWVEPVLVGEVEYGQITLDGMLRHASWRGLRPDKDPGEVRLE
jgi:bifunctional non-homologous end joining protein LigD